MRRKVQIKYSLHGAKIDEQVIVFLTKNATLAERACLLEE